MKTEHLLLLGAVGIAAYALYRHRKRERLTVVASGRRRNPTARTSGERQALTKAQQVSEAFHGNGRNVIELSEQERRLPKYVVALGSVPELVYKPVRGSRRGGVEYIHESGDRGIFAGRSKKRPILAADPRTGRPLIVPMGSGMRLESDRGLVG